MRKTLSLLLTASVVLGAFAAPAAEAKKKKKKKINRTATATYDTPAIGVGGVAGVCSGANGCAAFPAAPGEKFIQVEVTDASGTPVYGRIAQDLDGDNQADTAVAFCGKSDKVVIEPGAAINVFIYANGALPAPCAGVGTNGTVKATFTN